MSIPIQPVIYIGVFLAVFLTVEGLYLLVFGKSITANKKLNRRLDLLSQGARREEVIEQLRRESSQHQEGNQIPLYSLLADQARKANIAFSPSQLISIMAGASLVIFLVLTIATSTALPIRIGAAIVMSVGGIYMWIANKAKTRLALLQEQLPDAVELMVRSLRVGHPFSSTLAAVSSEIKDPLATEFGMVSDEAAFGADMGETLKQMAQRLDMQDMRFLAVAVSIQQTSGGNLAEILDGLAKVIRARFRLFRRVKAITSEARFAGTFLSAFPVVALVAINIMDPNYYDEVMEQSWFIPACLIVVAFLVANIVVMRALVNIKV